MLISFQEFTKLLCNSIIDYEKKKNTFFYFVVLITFTITINTE